MEEKKNYKQRDDKKYSNDFKPKKDFKAKKDKPFEKFYKDKPKREEKFNFFKDAWETEASLERKRKPKEPDEITFSKSLDDVEEIKFHNHRKAKGANPKKSEDKKVPWKKDFKNKEDYKKEKKSYYKDADFKDKFTSFKKKERAYDAGADDANKKKKYDGRDKKLEKEIAREQNPEAKMPLNKFIAHCGVCSRRDAVELIKNGKVKVNGEVETSPGYKVQEGDTVIYNNKKIMPSKNYTYILLNKPKGYITTTDDPKGRRTVLDIFKDEIEERIFPVGRLDRNTTGLLLLTNDGELAQKLTHPKYEKKKVYQVKLDKPLTHAHFDQIKEGLFLEDGKAEVDKITYLDTADEIGMEIHSGKNRIVRRIFESLEYQVEKLDRVSFAGLTKKNLPKGAWRPLTRQEVINLKHLGR